jgi:hypothetical protein
MSARELLATDETFRQVADLLFGAGAPEVFSKMNPEGADLSARKKRERTEARIGLATNIVGIGAGIAATPPAVKAVGEKHRELKGKKAATGPKHRGHGRIAELKPIAAARKAGSTPKGALAIAGGAAGLQVGNLGGDFVANRVLSRSAKKDPNVKGGTATAVRVTREKVKDIHKSAKDIPEAAQSPKKGKGGGKVTLAPMPTKRGAGVGNKFSSGHFKRLPEKIKQGPKVSKRATEYDVVWEGEISKVDTDKRQVFGWASIVEMNGEPVVDLQGDYISIDEVEKSAYEYVHKSRKGGDMHLRDDFGEPKVGSHMIESMVVTPEKKKALGLPEEMPTGWWVGYQVNDDDLWAKVKSGERTGFSIHGRGVRSPA